MNYPEGLNDIISFYRSLPGIGEKNAIRLALATYEKSNQELENFAKSISDLKNNVKICSICGNISSNEICEICADQYRDNDVICVLEDYKNIYNFEKSSVYKGKYHVLGGLISPMDGINPEDLNITGLIDRIKKLDNPEVILALKSSIEGEMTMLYLKEILSKYNVKISRLSYGVPLGMNLEYMDVLSLDKALEDRKEIDN